MKKALLIMHQSDYVLYKDLISTNKNYDIYMPYKNNKSNFIIRIIRKIGLYRLNDWKNKLNEYEKIIIFDAAYKRRITKYLKKKNKFTILWIWNPIGPRQEKMLKDSYIDDIYTYNLIDSKKYDIKYNSQFYFDEIKKYCNKNSKYDTYFLGLDKGRTCILNNLKNEFDKQNITYDITIVKDSKNQISYLENIKKASDSKAIIEINSNTKNDGLTLRSLEALVLNKKIITNNKNIKNYNIYNKNNIFILGKDNIKNLKGFIDAPNKAIDKKTIEYYSLSAWIQRF